MTLKMKFIGGFVIILFLFIFSADVKAWNKVTFDKNGFVINSKDYTYEVRGGEFYFTPYSLDENIISKIIDKIPYEFPKDWSSSEKNKNEYIENGIFHIWKHSLNLYEVIPQIKKCIETEGGVYIGKRQGLAWIAIYIGVDKETEKVVIVIPAADSDYNPAVIHKYNLNELKSSEEQQKVIYCSNCGAKNPADAKFCSKCGKRLVSE